MISISTQPTNLSRLFFVALFAAFLTSTDVFSQGKFLDGYVISLKGDTLKGTIKNEGWDQSPAYIDFRDTGKTDTKKVGTEEASEFFIPSINSRYIRKKIAVINIDLSQIYTIPPSLQSKDSLVIFLRQVTSGPKASLFEYINSSSASHFYVEKSGVLTELINYPFYRLIRDKKYLLTYDDYKKQLPALLSDANLNDTQIPGYDQKDLRKYLDKYNEFFGGQKHNPSFLDEHDFLIDLTANVGAASWEEPGILLKSRFTYGFGMRVNLPRKFHNRYFKVNLLMIPSVSLKDIYKNNYGYDSKKISVKTLELGVGTYFGSGKIRPLAGIDYGFPFNTWRSSILGPHVGIGFFRKVNIELSHFANFVSVLSDTPFLNKPRISVNYYLNLNQFFLKK